MALSALTLPHLNPRERLSFRPGSPTPCGLCALQRLPLGHGVIPSLRGARDVCLIPGTAGGRGGSEGSNLAVPHQHQQGTKHIPRAGTAELRDREGLLLWLSTSADASTVSCPACSHYTLPSNVWCNVTF